LNSDTSGENGRQMLEFMICETNSKNASINGDRLTSNEIALFSEELGCSQLSANNQNNNSQNPIKKIMDAIRDAIRNKKL
jgi:hypothetical protein